MTSNKRRGPVPLLVTSLLVLVLLGSVAWFYSHNPRPEPVTKSATDSEAPAAQDTRKSEFPRAVMVIDNDSASMATQSQPGALSDVQKLEIVNAILSSGADNDPRLDKDLRELSPALRERLRRRYREIPNEKRNSKGTLVFLLGRNLTEPADFEFMAEVVSETPCFSLSDCSQKFPKKMVGRSEEEDHNGGLAVALAYPQLVALHSVGRWLETGREKSKVQQIIQKSLGSKVPEVVSAARELQKRFLLL